MSVEFENLEPRLGYTFNNKNLLRQALTHGSFSSDIHRNYERLEFLGDRILGMTIAEMLCQMFPDESEGALAQRFVRLVCKNAVAEVMRSLQVGRFILTISPEIRNKANVLCDVGEAIIAAIYLDSGDLAKAQEFIRQSWAKRIAQDARPIKDYKSALQERATAEKLELPVYSVLERTGPMHEPVFKVQVLYGNGLTAEGEGKTKKQAEQEAASRLIEMLEGGKDD